MLLSLLKFCCMLNDVVLFTSNNIDVHGQSVRYFTKINEAVLDLKAVLASLLHL